MYNTFNATSESLVFVGRSFQNWTTTNRAPAANNTFLLIASKGIDSIYSLGTARGGMGGHFLLVSGKGGDGNKHYIR